MLEWAADPYAFLTGKDPLTNLPMVYTKDERDTVNAVKAFPDKPYLRELTQVLLEDGQVGVLLDKTRQMITTTLCMLLIMWMILFRDGRRILIMKRTEDESKELIRDKLRFPYSRLPAWFKTLRFIDRKPADRAFCDQTFSYALVCNENAAESVTRGGTASLVLVDEAARTMHYGAVVRASLPMATRYWGITTPPETMIAGAVEFRAEADQIKTSPVVEIATPIQGMKIYRDREAVRTLIELHYTADPDKRSPAWANHERKRMANRAAWNREYEMDWSAPGEAPYHADFSENPRAFVFGARGFLLAGVPIIRSYDLGIWYPACVWAQIGPKTKRLWIIRELMVPGCDAWNFRDLVRYLSGQIPYEQLLADDRTRAIEWLSKCEELGYPPHPWFDADSVHFEDIAGHEAKMAQSLSSEGARTNEEAFSAGGIFLDTYWTKFEFSTRVIQGLLLPRADGFPGLLIDPACKTLIRGLTSGIQRQTGSDKPRKDGYYEHLYDCLRYLTNRIEGVAKAEDRSQTHAGEGVIGSGYDPSTLQTTEARVIPDLWNDSQDPSIRSGLLDAWE